MNKFLIAGNWKMNTDKNSAIELAEKIKNHLPKIKPDVEVLVCPPSINIAIVSDVLKDSTIKVGAQNAHFFKEGAYTGEISVPMIKSYHCDYIILGHSERREYFNEDNQLISQKVQATLDFDLNAIVCIGETLQERRAGRTFDILKNQLRACVSNVNRKKIDKLTIAYEPVWAIGTGESADTIQIEESHKIIRDELNDLFGSHFGEQVRILYGGSVNSRNAKEILKIKNVNGALIGGASLDAQSFATIVNYAEELID